MSPTLVDQAVRGRVRQDPDTSFVLVAGAGTGKTTLLVDRVEMLIRSGRADLTEIAAVTFTENAATTLKLRLRERLERVRADDRAAVEERARAALALDVLERAMIATIHSLCAAMLQERPIECGVLPGFEIADETESDQLFAEAWDDWLAGELVCAESAVLEALDHGIPLDSARGWNESSSLKGLARRLVDQRDLVPRVAAAAVDPLAWRDELVAATSAVARLIADAQPEDRLASRLRELAAFAEQARFLAGGALSAHLERLPVVPRRLGQKRLWPDESALRTAREVASWTHTARERWDAARGAALHARLIEALSGVVRLYERKKNARGRLDFLDLLMKTRDALRTCEPLRREFGARFRCVIIDEFQDTDPLQCEIAELLTAERPGALVVVGDAKQSIYRFRRAEVSRLARLAREADGAPHAATLHLTQNFRSRPAILSFVNRAFSRLIVASPDDEQPGYEPLVPRDDLTPGRAVVALRFTADASASGEDLLRAEAAGLARFVASASDGRWTVRDPVTDQKRPSRVGDVMVLARRLTRVQFLEEALEAKRLRFVVEGGKGFFGRQEVHETLAVLRAVDDVTDEVALVAALRSTFFGVSDREIAAYVLAGGRLSIEHVASDLPGAEAITPALTLLARLNEQRRSASVPMLLERLYDETRVLAALASTRRGEAQVANLEKVVALARTADRTRTLTLRAFVRLLSQRVADGSEEPDLPATRPDDPATVRILSIHRAKGLEAPIVALYDTADDGLNAVDIVALRDSGEVAIGFRAGCQPPGWPELVEREQGRASAERRRLLYVACTRARDWLVVPRPPADACVGAFWGELIAELPTASDDDVDMVDAESLSAAALDDAVGAENEEACQGEVDAQGSLWERERRERLTTAASRALVPMAVTRTALEAAPPSATRVVPREAKAFGTLVHRLLEWVPLADAQPAATLALAQALAHDLALDADAVQRATAHVARSLAHPLFERARQGQALRELPIWLPEEGRLLEGRVDLVFGEGDGLVVVDYKTEPVLEADLLDRAAYYAPQLRLYARALALATGRPVRERLVFFTDPGRAVPV